MTRTLDPTDEPPFEPAPKPKGKAAEVREIGRVALDKLKIGAAKRGLDPAKGQPIDGVKPGRWTPNDIGLPKEHPCPVEICGKDGEGLWCIDVDGELRRVEATPFGQATIQSLFGDRQLWLYWAFPRVKKTDQVGEDGEPVWIVDAWRAELAREAFWTAASRKGTWNPASGIRGRGAWKDGQGRLVYHFGDGLWRGGKVAPVGEIDGVWYIAAKPIPRPWSEPVDDELDPGPALVEAFRTFNWARPQVDPVLAFGVLLEMLVSAALEWRAHAFVDGPSGSGKSTLLGLLKDIVGPIVVSATDTTAAGVYQQMGFEGRPVILDEVEADNARSIDLIKLARTSSDEEGQMSRGGADHKSVQFELRSVYVMAAINRPYMAPQDLNRFLLLTLHPLDKAKAKTAPVIAAIDTIGPKLLRRLAERWTEFDEVYQAFAEVLREAGHEPRGQKTYGVPLTLAHLALGDGGLDRLGLPMENFWAWINLLGRAELAHEGEISNWRAPINHLMGASIEIWRHGQLTMVGQLLEAMRRGGEHATTTDEAGRMLAQIGLKLVAKGAPRKGEPARKGWTPGDDGWWLAVPNEGDKIWEIYRGTTWGSPMRGKGGWAGAIRQCPEALGLISTDKDFNRIRVNGWQGRATLIDLDRWFEMMDEEED